jgi:hypothetical protein
MAIILPIRNGFSWLEIPSRLAKKGAGERKYTFLRTAWNVRGTLVIHVLSTGLLTSYALEQANPNKVLGLKAVRIIEIIMQARLF